MKQLVLHFEFTIHRSALLVVTMLLVYFKCRSVLDIPNPKVLVQQRLHNAPYASMMIPPSLQWQDYYFTRLVLTVQVSCPKEDWHWNCHWNSPIFSVWTPHKLPHQTCQGFDWNSSPFASPRHFHRNPTRISPLFFLRPPEYLNWQHRHEPRWYRQSHPTQSTSARVVLQMGSVDTRTNKYIQNDDFEIETRDENSRRLERQVSKRKGYDNKEKRLDLLTFWPTAENHTVYRAGTPSMCKLVEWANLLECIEKCSRTLVVPVENMPAVICRNWPYYLSKAKTTVPWADIKSMRILSSTKQRLTIG